MVKVEIRKRKSMTAFDLSCHHRCRSHAHRQVVICAKSKTFLGTGREVKRAGVRNSIMTTMIDVLRRHKEVVGCYNLFFCYRHLFGRKRSFVKESAENEKNVYERVAHIVASLGGNYENINGDISNGTGPWLYGLAGIQQRR